MLRILIYRCTGFLTNFFSCLGYFFSWYPALISGGVLILATNFLYRGSHPPLVRPYGIAWAVILFVVTLGLYISLRRDSESESYVFRRSASLGVGMAIPGMGILILSAMCSHADSVIHTSLKHIGSERTGKIRGDDPYLFIPVKVQGVVVDRKLSTKYNATKWNIKFKVHEMASTHDNQNLSGYFSHTIMHIHAEQPCPVAIGHCYSFDGKLRIRRIDHKKLFYNELYADQIEEASLLPSWGSFKELNQDYLSMFWEYIGEGRLRVHRFIESKIALIFPLSERVCQVLLSLCLGIPLPYEIQQDIHRVGMDHMFAISGFHFGCVTLAIASLLRGIGERRALCAVACISTVFFFIVGPDAPSVLRSWMTVLITIIAFFGVRQPLGMNTLGVVIYLSLLIRPHFLFHVGFQLSFIATFALLLLSGPMKAIMDRYLFHKRNEKEIEELSVIDQLLYLVARFFSSALAVSVSIWIFIIPYSILLLDGFQPLGILYNILLTPLFSLSLIGGFFSFLLWLISPLLAVPFALVVQSLILFSLCMIDVTAYITLKLPEPINTLFAHEKITYLWWTACFLVGIVMHVSWRKKEGLFETEIGREDERDMLHELSSSANERFKGWI